MRIPSVLMGMVALCIIFIILMNSQIIGYREKELVSTLDVISRGQSDVKSLGLISRYLIIKKRIEYLGEDRDDYITEAKLQGILRTIRHTNDPESDRSPNVGIIDRITRGYLAAVSFLLGKEIAEDILDAYNDPMIELAYFYERYRKYTRSLAVMNDIAGRRTAMTEFTRRTLMLHTGFCYAMLSDYEVARDAYTRLIRDFPFSQEADIARILLSYLSTIIDGTRMILKKSLPPEQKAEKLYLLSSYTQALKLYSVYFQKEGPAHPGFLQAKFYQARSIEELGRQDEAVMQYKNIISIGPGSTWALKSNQRLMLMGNFYKGGIDLANLARENSRRLGDEGFAKKIDYITGKINDEKFNETKIRRQYQSFLKTEPASILKNKPKGLHSARLIKKKGRRTDIDDKSALSGSARYFNYLVKTNILQEKKPDEKPAGEPKKSIPMAFIKTKDGFSVNGEIKSESASQIIIKTEFGEIPVNKSIIGTIKRYTK